MTLSRLLSLINEHLALVFMIIAIVLTAMAVVYSKHQSRVEFVALQQLERQRDHLNEEWERLLIEQSTWARPDHIEKRAKLDLNMSVPTADQIRVIQP